MRASAAGCGVARSYCRWLPEDRISIDQVPCNLREGDGRTYADVGSKRVWLAGNKHDDGKRFCTLQVAARCANGAPGTPRHGQPRLTILDNLHGQTTMTHLTNLARNGCKRHLLPAGTTDELQLIDAGVGHALKTEMAHLHDEWLVRDTHLEQLVKWYPAYPSFGVKWRLSLAEQSSHRP